MFDLSRDAAQAVRDPAVQATRFCVAVVVLCPINLNNSCLPTYLPATTATRLSHVVTTAITRSTLFSSHLLKSLGDNFSL